MTLTDIIVIIGGLLLGYLIVANLLNKIFVSSTSTHTGNNAGNGAQQNGANKEEPNNSNSVGEDYPLTNWFLILEVSQGASKKEITAAYKQKIRQYHPDKVAQMGTEIRELAEFKSKQINTAYDYAMKLKN